jgi:hypothetical protein
MRVIVDIDVYTGSMDGQIWFLGLKFGGQARWMTALDLCLLDIKAEGLFFSLKYCLLRSHIFPASL